MSRQLMGSSHFRLGTQTVPVTMSTLCTNGRALNQLLLTVNQTSIFVTILAGCKRHLKLNLICFSASYQALTIVLSNPCTSASLNQIDLLLIS